MTRDLNSQIGQAVHLIYLLNTAGRTLGAADVDRLCEVIGQRFPGDVSKGPGRSCFLNELSKPYARKSVASMLR